MSKNYFILIILFFASALLIYAVFYYSKMAESREIEIPVIVGNVNSISFDKLVSNLDARILGLRIRVERASSEQTKTISYSAEQSSDGYLNVSKYDRNVGVGVEVLIHDGYYYFRDGWIVDGFYILSQTGPHQGQMSYALKMIEPEKVLLNPNVQLHEVSVDISK
jgi:hypothetical protein